MIKKHPLEISPLKIIIFSFILFYSCISLHLHDSTSDYIAYLKGQQQNLHRDLSNLSHTIKQNEQTVQKQNSLDKKIKLLQDGLRAQRLLLSDITLSMANEQLKASEWVCPQLDQAKKDMIIDDLGVIQDDLNQIEDKLQNVNDQDVGEGIDEAKEEIDDSKKTAALIGGAIAAVGGTQIAKDKFPSEELKTNLNSPDWLLDGTNMDDVNQQYKQAAEKGSLKLCPLNKPFQQEGHCIGCSDGKLFSLRQQKCIVCQNVDQENHVCKDNDGAATNYDSVPDKLIVPDGKNLDDYKSQEDGQQPCPSTAPFYTGKQCISCQHYFDLEKKQCRQCDGSSVYNPKTHVCKLEELDVTNLQAGKQALIIPPGKTLDDLKKQQENLKDKFDLKTCPDDKPFWNDYQCMKCQDGMNFYLEKKSCGTCQKDRYFNPDTNHCQKSSFYTNLDDPNWSSTKTFTEVKDEIQQKKQNPLYQQCPIQRPFSKGEECIECSGDYHFDLQKKQCKKCYNGQYFNINLHKCQYKHANYQTNPATAPNLIYEGKPKNEWIYYYNKNIQENDSIADCPKQDPFFDGNSCILCPDEHPYFNLESKMCQKCPANTKYSEKHHECLTTEGNIATQVPTLQKMAAGIFA